MIEAGTGGLQLGKGVERHVQRFVAHSVGVDLHARFPIRPQEGGELLPADISAQPVAPVEVAQKVYPQRQGLVRPVCPKLDAMEAELVG